MGGREAEWALDENEYIRRFASEFTRPRGVWCKNEMLFSEESNNVRRIKYVKRCYTHNDNQEDCIKSPWFKSKTVVPHNLPKSIDYKFAWNETGLLEVDGEEPALEEPKE